ncbi:hypothetical protein [Pelotomaculum propionicicum]|uniref:Uncharacterized protein n=1 Tax=Pelotomaculum propionicicum TaxID=258475 RepID=A0A4Y7RM30_9FIRM|nr:hypothetical protein [Pelotomaculum propionicicum]NLI12942.1 hypothetical protein [Peptococcaceae bacterium]TEB09790.1 hypothetical protein Pmgp_02886 [Pelotomaculum propionicicum]
MAGGIVLIVTVIFLAVISVRERIRTRLMREKDWGFIGETKASQISQALANLIGVAGGIYLTLMVAATFLELQLPARVHFGGISMEPLAAISIIIALAQPFAVSAMNAWRRL